MKERKYSLKQPEATYGRVYHLEDRPFTPVHNLRETLRAKGYVTQEELLDKYSKYL